VPFWRGEDIQKRGGALIEPFSDEQIDCNAYVLRMGAKYFGTSDGAISDGKIQAKTVLAPAESFVIPPGQFAYLLTKETIKVPHDAMAFISMRTQLKFEGLINVSGFHVDPGYEGKLLYAVFNAGPSAIAVSEDERLFKIWFCDLTTLPVAESEKSKFRKRPQDGIYDIDNRLIHGMSPPIVSLQGLAEDIRAQQRSLANLESSVNAKFDAQRPTLDNLTTIYRTLTISLAVAAIVGIMGLVFPTAVHEGYALEAWLFSQPASPKHVAKPPGQIPSKPPQGHAPTP